MVLLHEPTPPRWHGYFTEGPYKGRKAWWSALGYRDPIVEEGRFRMFHYRFEEEDPYYKDPPLPDGESMVNNDGVDPAYRPDPAYKSVNDHRSLPDFQKDRYENSAQIKDIKAKYNISPEHPGMKYLPDFSGSTRFDFPWRQGVLGTPGYLGFRHWGPRFFDAPIDQQCGVKAAALAKYTAQWMMVPAYYNMIFNQPPGVEYTRSVGNFLKEYVKCAPVPIACMAAWGGTVCMIADYRQKQSVTNYYLATLGSSIIYGAAKQSFAKCIQCFYLGCLASTGAYLLMYQESGHSGHQPLRDGFSVWNHERYLDWRTDKEARVDWRVPEAPPADRPWYDTGMAGLQ